jgi:hypothetical protein
MKMNSFELYKSAFDSKLIQSEILMPLNFMLHFKYLSSCENSTSDFLWMLTSNFFVKSRKNIL